MPERERCDCGRPATGWRLLALIDLTHAAVLLCERCAAAHDAGEGEVIGYRTVGGSQTTAGPGGGGRAGT